MSWLRKRAATDRTAPSIALAGAGYIAVVHALAARSAGLSVRAVASRGASARHLAGELDVARVSLDALPAGADVLVVATPPESHAELAVRGLDAGARVLVEKPLCVDLEQADRLVEAAETAEGAGSVLRCAENLLHAPSWRALMDRRAVLGTLTHLSLRTMQPPPDWGHFAHPLVHGGVLFDLGPHPIALALAAAAEPVVSVQARLGSGREDGADDEASVQLRFASGLVATIELSWRAAEVVWDLQAASPTGVLRLELLPELRLEHDGDGVEVPSRHDVVDARLEQFGYVDQLRSIAGLDDGPGQSAADARSVLELITAAYAAAGSGDEVPLPFSGRRDRSPMSWWRDPDGCES